MCSRTEGKKRKFGKFSWRGDNWNLISESHCWPDFSCVKSIHALHWEGGGGWTRACPFPPCTSLLHPEAPPMEGGPKRKRKESLDRKLHSGAFRYLPREHERVTNLRRRLEKLIWRRRHSFMKRKGTFSSSFPLHTHFFSLAWGLRLNFNGPRLESVAHKGTFSVVHDYWALATDDLGIDGRRRKRGRIHSRLREISRVLRRAGGRRRHSRDSWEAGSGRLREHAAGTLLESIARDCCWTCTGCARSRTCYFECFWQWSKRVLLHHHPRAVQVESYSPPRPRYVIV